jgi:outer membrane murein-binding lipoprotein Lpp
VLAGGETKQLQNQVAQMQQQLHAKDEQLAAKDRQIQELIKAAKKPRTVNHNTNNSTTNRYVVEQNINVFGKETMGHITPEQIQRLLADPESAVAKLVKLKHRKEPSNSNVRCPNVNRAIYQVVVGGEGEEKEWENRAKGEVLEMLYDDNSTILEGEAVEEEHTPFLDHQDMVKASAAANAADGGRRYKEQLDRIHNVIIN